MVQEIQEEPIIYLGRDDMVAYEHARLLQQEVESHWSLPPGLPADLQCVVSMKVAKDGTIVAEIVKSSGVLMYDVSARCAVAVASLSKHLWGKDYTVVF